MNDIQTEINFFEWFYHYFKPKILTGRNTNSKIPLLQKEVTQRISNSPLNTSNTIITKDVSTNHAYKISNIPSLTLLTRPQVIYIYLIVIWKNDLDDIIWRLTFMFKKQTNDLLIVIWKNDLDNIIWRSTFTFKKQTNDLTNKLKKYLGKMLLVAPNHHPCDEKKKV